MRHHLGRALPIGGVCLCLFGFGFLAGLTVNAPWGAGPAAVCAAGALAPAAFLLHHLRRRGRTAGLEGPGGLDAPFAYGIAVALGLAAAALLLAARPWTGAALFWPACFALMSAGLTVYGDARVRAERSADPEDQAEDEETALPPAPLGATPAA